MAFYTIERCPCGSPGCSDWHVLWVAAVRGVKFTEKQAKAVADLLNSMEEPSTAGEHER